VGNFDASQGTINLSKVTLLKGISYCMDKAQLVCHSNDNGSKNIISLQNVCQF